MKFLERKVHINKGRESRVACNEISTRLMVGTTLALFYFYIRPHFIPQLFDTVTVAICESPESISKTLIEKCKTLIEKSAHQPILLSFI